MGGKGSGRPTKEQSIMRKLNVGRSPEIKTPIASEMFLPNHSGDHGYMTAKRITINGTEGKSINATGDIRVIGTADSPYSAEGGGIVIEPYETGGFSGHRAYCRLIFNPEKRDLTVGNRADVILSAHKYHNDGSAHEHFSLYTTDSTGTAKKRLNIKYLQDQAQWTIENSYIQQRAGYFAVMDDTASQIFCQNTPFSTHKFIMMEMKDNDRPSITFDNDDTLVFGTRTNREDDTIVEVGILEKNGHFTLKSPVGYPMLILDQEDSETYTSQFEDRSSTQFIFTKTGSAEATIDINPAPQATDNAMIRFFRSTNTSGAKSFKIMKGDDTDTIIHDIEAADTTIFNYTKASAQDFNIRGANDTNLFYVDASADKIGINNNAPTERLDVTGNIKASGTITGSNISGTNTGDQTSIVGITGTIAQFNTACTDQDFAYSGGAFHDGFSDFVANEHIDWTSASSNFSTSGTLRATGDVMVGSTSAPDARLEIETGSTEGHQAVTIDQNDADQAFIDFQGTPGTPATSNITTSNGTGSVAGPLDKGGGATGWKWEGMVAQEINGTKYWVPYFSWEVPEA